MLAIEWTAQDIITAAGVLVAILGIISTTVVSVVNTVTNGRRERDMHAQALAADRAKGYRESALDTVAMARNALNEGEGRPLGVVKAGCDLPGGPGVDFVEYVNAVEEVQSYFVSAQQSSLRLASLGWTPDVRSTAKQLSDALLHSSLALWMPTFMGTASIPESDEIAAGTHVMWIRHRDQLTDDLQQVREAIDAFLVAIQE